MRQKLLVFCEKKSNDFKNNLENDEFIIRLAHLLDIFEVVSNMTLFL